MNPKAKILAAKYAVYALLLLVLYVLQTTPRLFELFSVKPNLVAAAALAIAMYEGEFAGGLYGALAGTFCDLGAFTIFGFNAVILMISGVLTGLLVIYMLRNTVTNFVLLALGMFGTRGLLDYLLDYLMWDHEGVALVFSRQILPTILYSVAVAPVCYYLVRTIFGKFQVLLED